MGSRSGASKQNTLLARGVAPVVLEGGHLELRTRENGVASDASGSQGVEGNSVKEHLLRAKEATVSISHFNTFFFGLPARGRVVGPNGRRKHGHVAACKAWPVPCPPGDRWSASTLSPHLIRVHPIPS